MLKKRIDIIAICISFLFLVSCDVFKKTQTDNQTTARTNNVDSGNVKKNSSERNTDEQWWRETLQIILSKKDTNVNNIYPILNGGTANTQTYPQPIVTFIKEGGNKQTQEKVFNYDSAFKSMQDSLFSSLKTEKKEKETNVFPVDRILAFFIGFAVFICILMFTFMFLISKQFNKITQPLQLWLSQNKT